MTPVLADMIDSLAELVAEEMLAEELEAAPPPEVQAEVTHEL